MIGLMKNTLQTNYKEATNLGHHIKKQDQNCQF